MKQEKQDLNQPVQRRKLLGALGLYGLGTAALSSAFLKPAQAQGAAVAIGVVDEDHLADGYKKYKDAIGALDQRAQSLDKQLAGRELLNETEARRFDDLIQKATRTPAEEADLQKLIDTGTDRRAKLIGLMGKATRNDLENAGMKELQDLATGNQPGFQKIQDALYNKVKQDQQETDNRYTEQANKVIEDVAKGRALTLVVRKRAVIYNAPAVDITDDVLRRLNGA